MHPRSQLLSGHLATWCLVARSSATRRSLATTATPTTPTPTPTPTTTAPIPEPATPSSKPATADSTSTPTPAVKNPLQRRKGGDLGAHLPKHVISADAHMPEYPYGDYALYKQANRGLYGEQTIQFGNNVSHKTKTKTRRDWKPNVLTKSLYSVALKKRVKLRITSKVLKTMDREGGLDEYLLKDSIQRIKELGPMGWALRWTLMQKPEVIERLRADAAALNIDQATIDKQWPTPQMVSQKEVADAFLARQAELAARDPEGANGSIAPEMWAPATQISTNAAGALEREESRIANKAALEYDSCLRAAERYHSDGLVDSVEEGLKVAFVRADERRSERKQSVLAHSAKLSTMFTSEDLQAIRQRFNLPDINDKAARKIAYNQWRRAEVAKTEGGYEVWHAAQLAANKAAEEAENQAAIDEAGGIEAFNAARKASFAAQVAAAETASTNEALRPIERRRMAKAIEKADRAIRARRSGGREAFAQFIIERVREQQPKKLARAAEKSTGADKDAWGALVKESQKPETVRA
jgi:large subunit ribosomal protein L28